MMTFALGCIECPWKELFSVMSTIEGKQMLPLAMGFRNIEKVFKKFNVLCSPQRAKFIENRDFS